MTLSLAGKAACAAIVVAGLLSGGAVAAPKATAELSLAYHASQAKWNPEAPLFGAYIGSGDGSGSGALAGIVHWDLYEDQTLPDQHPAFFRGVVERNGQQHSFKMIGIYTPVSADKKHWRLSGTIVFDDDQVLKARHAPIVGSFDGTTGTAHYTILTDAKPKRSQ
jgi:hypothetical protein